MHDDLQCNLPIPDGRVPPETWFQTKSLNCGMDKFTITTTGRLILHRTQYQSDKKHAVEAGGVALPYLKPSHVEDIDMYYHGDILVVASAANGSLVEYVVRFTHGTVEWIRPYQSLSETHKSWFYSKS